MSKNNADEMMTGLVNGLFKVGSALGRNVADISNRAALLTSPFLRITTSANEELLFDTQSGLLWDPGYREEPFSGLAQVRDTLSELQGCVNVGAWRLPNHEEMLALIDAPSCPYRLGNGGNLFGKKMWLVKQGIVDLDYRAFDVDRFLDGAEAKKARLMPVNAQFRKLPDELLAYVAKNGWSVGPVADRHGQATAPPPVHVAPARKPGSNNEAGDPVKSMAAQKLAAAVAATGQHKTTLKTVFESADFRRAKLPMLDERQLTDPRKGLWEFWGMPQRELDEAGVRARNPADDVRHSNVAIDFGTSSTVVALDDNGTRKLLRIGVTDFFESPKPAHYENPTVLEFVDLAEMLKPWRSEAYRPNVLWDDVRCSHEALHNFRNNEANPEVVASILTKIKQWALREGDGTGLRLTDQTQHLEHELAPLTLRQPVKGRLLEVGDSDPLDPVELYAWFLGLTINWRGRGIFLRYYMTFPVAYPREVKERVLASFRRGLQRSLPLSLVSQPVFEQFTVEERATEPAAYAATALPALGIEPTAQGVAYAVFDFGGGTTDFDFGYYRLPTEEQADDEGWESVFEHFGSGGDVFLGGENLLDHLAYLTFRHNLEVCRKHKITFSKPLDAKDFPGSEPFLDHAQAAETNSLMLTARLRPFWEKGAESNRTGIEKIELLARDGKKVTCEFTVPYAELKAFLQSRIEQGVFNFFASLKKAFGDQLPARIEVLLAGNGSRSAIVQGFFGLWPDAPEQSEKTHEYDKLAQRTHAYCEKLFAENFPVFTPHAPLANEGGDVNDPNGKTGVALGLLRLCPGSATLVINRAVDNAIGDAPFLHYVGRIRLGKFHVCVPQGAPYHQWVELGPIRERVFYLIHSQEARAHLGEMKEGDVGLSMLRLDFAGDTTGHRAYGRAISPHEIEVCSAPSADLAGADQVENLQRIKLGS